MEENQQRKFKIGDTVQLKSGGPTMTVNGAPRERRGGDVGFGWTKPVECVWFDCYGPASISVAMSSSVHTDVFEEDALVACEPSPEKQSEGIRSAA